MHGPHHPVDRSSHFSTLGHTVADKNPGTLIRPIAVVQTNPFVYGTDNAVKNYGTYVDCEP